MNVGHVITLVKEWVEGYGSHRPGFCGAHLAGHILSMPQEMVFPPNEDVDFCLVVRGKQELETHDLAYHGLILEYGVRSSERYRTAETVLADPELASNLAVQSILFDPAGLLHPLHIVVKQEYAKRSWVQARCDYEKQMVTHFLEEVSQAASLEQALVPLTFALLYLAGLLLVADLRPPTQRRALVLMRDVLQQQGRGELQEEVLGLLGYAHLTRPQVQAHLHDAASAFDRAVQVKRTPIAYEFKLQPHVRPYLVEGTQELIEQGHHREVMWLIMAMLIIANTAIQLDAPEAEKPFFQARLDRLLQELGFDVRGAVQTRLQGARELARTIFMIADEMVEHQPAGNESMEAD